MMIIKWRSIYLMIVVVLMTNTSCKNKQVGEKSNTVVSTESVITSSFKVWGNCEMCKETIEGASTVNGVLKTDWNIETKQIEVSYDTTKITLDQIQKNIAAAGYDNEKYKSEEKAFGKLPECCQYDRKK